MKRFILVMAAMAAMVCVGCDKLNTQGPQGPKGDQGEKGDKGDPGIGVAEIGDYCKSDADCGEAGKCNTAGKFCAWTSGDDIVATVRKRREADVRKAEEALQKAGEALDNAYTICSDTSGDCKIVDEAKKHVESADKRLQRAQDRLALVTPASVAEPPKTEATAKAEIKAGKKGEKSAGEKLADDKAGSDVKSAAKAKKPTTGTRLTAVEAGVDALGARLDATDRAVVGLRTAVHTAHPDISVEFEEEAENEDEEADETVDPVRLSACVAGVLKSLFFAENLMNDTDARKEKAEEVCRDKQSG